MPVSLNVLLVHAIPLTQLGGAELSFRYHVNHAPGHVNVDVVLPDDEVDLSLYDAVVLGNLRPNGGFGSEAQFRSTLRWARKLIAYQGFVMKSERDIHPCSLRDGRCLSVAPIRKTACKCSHLMQDATELLYNNCMLVQFLSPAHQQAINQLVTIHTEQVLIAPPIDLSLFQSTTPIEERQSKALIIGDAIRVAASAKKRAREAGYKPKRIKYLSIPYEKMSDLYNSYQAVVIDPVMFHAFGRIFVEASSCGCKVFASDRVGALSWDEPVLACHRANEEFWSVVCNGVAAVFKEPSGA